MSAAPARPRFSDKFSNKKRQYSRDVFLCCTAFLLFSVLFLQAENLRLRVRPEDSACGLKASACGTKRNHLPPVPVDPGSQISER